jgi:hypothetical protein
MHIHAGAQGRCPPASAARLHGGHTTISTSDGGAFYGKALASLTTRGDTSVDSFLVFTRYPKTGNIRYSRTLELTSRLASLIRENNAVILIHGIDYNGNGVYDAGLDRSDLKRTLPGEATAPALCGALVAGAKGDTSLNQRRSTATEVYTASLHASASGFRADGEATSAMLPVANPPCSTLASRNGLCEFHWARTPNPPSGRGQPCPVRAARADTPPPSAFSRTAALRSSTS